MKVKIKLLGLLAICLAAAFATSGIAAGSASAVCMHVKKGEKSAWEDSKCTKAKAEGGWIQVEGAGVPVTGEPGVYCYKVKAGEKSAWEDSQCTKAKAEGGFIKVVGCNNKTAIAGQGSSLQKLAQVSLWIPESGCEATYSSTGSGNGRKAFGEEKAGEALNKEDTYVATDEPLSTAQMEHGDEAAKGVGQTIVIPVEQAAVAVIVNPPEKCKLAAITNQNLWEIWNGTITEWSQITGKIKAGEGGVTEEAGGCKKKITRFVRSDVSGTTFVFKKYLSEIEKVKSLTKACGNNWSQLDTPENNKVWPVSGSEGCMGLSPLFESSTEGGGGEAKEVAEEVKGTKEGSIGYANLADARAKLGASPRYTWVKIENENGASTKGFFPGADNKNAGKEPTKEPGQSNCEGTAYGSQPAVGADDNWSAVNGANPGGGTEKNTNYPICTLTYDVALANYTKAEYPNAAEVQAATKEYLEYVVNEGQEKLAENDYLKVEEAVGTKAKELVGKI